MRFLILFIGLCFQSLASSGQNQLEMNAEAAKNFKKADRKLNDIYQEILKEYKSDTVFIKYFKKSQRIWIQLRDAEMDAKFPHSEEYGSVFPLCWSMHKQFLTEERTKAIKVWLDGIEEGDVCSGSIKIKGEQ